jgi:hypothetical protein
MSDLGIGVVFTHKRVRKLLVCIPFDYHDDPELYGGEETGAFCAVFHGSHYLHVMVHASQSTNGHTCTPDCETTASAVFVFALDGGAVGLACAGGGRSNHVRHAFTSPSLPSISRLPANTKPTPKTTISEFTIAHDHHIQMTHSQMTTLASRWTSLEVFYPACEPVKLTTPSTLTLHVFVLFPQYRAEMRELGLFVDAGVSASDIDVIINVGVPQFKNLTQVFRVGIGYQRSGVEI